DLRETLGPLLGGYSPFDGVRDEFHCFSFLAPTTSPGREGCPQSRGVAVRWRTLSQCCATADRSARTLETEPVPHGGKHLGAPLRPCHARPSYLDRVRVSGTSWPWTHERRTAQPCQLPGGRAPPQAQSPASGVGPQGGDEFFYARHELLSGLLSCSSRASKAATFFEPRSPGW